MLNYGKKKYSMKKKNLSCFKIQYTYKLKQNCIILVNQNYLTKILKPYEVRTVFLKKQCD